MRLFIRRALEKSPFHILHEAETADEAKHLTDIDKKHEIDLVIVSDGLGLKAAKHILEHLGRIESPAKTLGIYKDKEFYKQRVGVTSEIKHDEVVQNPSNLRNLIARI